MSAPRRERGRPGWAGFSGQLGPQLTLGVVLTSGAWAPALWMYRAGFGRLTGPAHRLLSVLWQRHPQLPGLADVHPVGQVQQREPGPVPGPGGAGGGPLWDGGRQEAHPGEARPPALPGAMPASPLVCGAPSRALRGSSCRFWICEGGGGLGAREPGLPLCGGENPGAVPGESGGLVGAWLGQGWCGVSRGRGR